MMIWAAHIGTVLLLAGIFVIWLSSRRSASRVSWKVSKTGSWINLGRFFEDGLFLAVLGAFIILLGAIVRTLVDIVFWAWALIAAAIMVLTGSAA